MSKQDKHAPVVVLEKIPLCYINDGGVRRLEESLITLFEKNGYSSEWHHGNTPGISEWNPEKVFWIRIKFDRADRGGTLLVTLGKLQARGCGYGKSGIEIEEVHTQGDAEEFVRELIVAISMTLLPLVPLI